jgi:hypothetical protein
MPNFQQQHQQLAVALAQQGQQQARQHAELIQRLNDLAARFDGLEAR